MTWWDWKIKKEGQSVHPEFLFRGFCDVIDDCGLTDMPLIGYPYTWHRKEGGEIILEERIDRALLNPGWFNLFLNSKLSNVISLTSDHSPIFLECVYVVYVAKPPRFRLENKWIREQWLEDIVHNFWNSTDSIELLHRLNECSNTLYTWGKDLARKFRRDIDNCRNQLLLLRNKTDRDSVEQFGIVKNFMVQLVIQENDYWKQLAKLFWLHEGDMNTKLFHQTVKLRKKRNKIHKLFNEEGLGRG